MSWVIWIEGLPGSGKTTLARQAAGALAAEGVSVEVLEYADVAETIGGGSGAITWTRAISRSSGPAMSSRNGMIPSASAEPSSGTITRLNIVEPPRVRFVPAYLASA